MASLFAIVGCKEKMVELQTDLPPASIYRNKKHYNSSGEALLVPEDTKLLSRGAEVTTNSDYVLFGEPEKITDGNPEQEFNNYQIEIDGGEWVQIDLGESYCLYAILVWHLFDPFTPDGTGEGEEICNRVYQDVIVQVSDDSAFKKDVETVFNNDQDGSSGLGKGGNSTYTETINGLWIATNGSKGRYVRLYNSGYMYECRGKIEGKGYEKFIGLASYIEVEVYGK